MASADVYKNGAKAARLKSLDGGTEFSYLGEYLSSNGPPISTTLPLSAKPQFTASGAVPPFFAGLLPEGRRLTALRQQIKASADDELSLLIAVGDDTVGDVQVVESGSVPGAQTDSVELPPSLSEIRFADLIGRSGADEGVGLPGVQDKVSGGMISLPASCAGNQYILKLNPPEFPHVVENEAYFLELSAACRISSAKGQIVHDRDGASALLVTRFDRERRGETQLRLAAEDGCQVLNRWPADKYNVTTEQVIDALAARCQARAVALRDAFRQWVFAVATGNGDLHAKNLSILEADGEWKIAPAYDLPSTVFYEDSTLALSAAGKKSGFSRRIALEFGERLGLRPQAAETVIAAVLDGTKNMLDELQSGAIPFDETRLRSGIKALRNRRELLELGS